MNRKKFILLATAGTAALAIPTWYYQFREIKYDPVLTEPELLSHIWDEENILQVGKAYREKFTEEDSERQLVGILSKASGSTTALLAASLQNQIVVDYQNNQVVMIDGWLLSITEARQCALYSLSTIK